MRELNHEKFGALVARLFMLFGFIIGLWLPKCSAWWLTIGALIVMVVIFGHALIFPNSYYRDVPKPLADFDDEFAPLSNEQTKSNA